MATALKGRKDRAMNANETESVEMQVDEPQPAKATKKNSKGKKSRAVSAQPVTLNDLSERYLEHLETVGKSHGTCFSYSIELKSACKSLGAETPIGALTVQDVQRYFDSDAVMKLKTGRPKAAPSYLKTQRVLRLALCWAVEQGWLDRAPIPQANEVK